MSNAKRNTKLWNRIVYAVVWSIWLEGNGRLFKEESLGSLSKFRLLGFGTKSVTNIHDAPLFFYLIKFFDLLIKKYMIELTWNLGFLILFKCRKALALDGVI